jgi:hypothetical protein
VVTGIFLSHLNNSLQAVPRHTLTILRRHHLHHHHHNSIQIKIKMFVYKVQGTICGHSWTTTNTLHYIIATLTSHDDVVL